MTDPRRALDSVDPPDLWPEILDRAVGDSGVPVSEPSRGRGLLLAAAVVVVLAGVAGGLVLVRADDGRPMSGDAIAEPPDVDPEPSVEGSFWGHLWDLTDLTVDGGPVAIPASGTRSDGLRPTASPLYLNTLDEGTVTFTGCNEVGVPAHLDEDLLVADPGLHRTEVGCDDELLRVDDLMAELLTATPQVTVDGARLVLDGGGIFAEFVREGEADGPCRLSIDVPNPVLIPGPSDPAVYANETFAFRGQIWHLLMEEQLVEVHVPIPVVMDLVGERTEQIQLDNGYRGNLWFTDDWVQLRVADPERSNEPCSNFTVTVSGLTPRDVAVYVGERVVLTEA